MIKLFILTFVSLTLLISNDKLPESVLKIIPKDYTVLNFTKGDLNRDKFDDAILILKHNNEEHNEYKRPLYILLGDENGTYKVVAKNNSVVLGREDGGIYGDPFEGVTIKRGYFSIEHYGGSSWRWSRIITFKYNKNQKDWFLYKDGEKTYHISNPQKTTTEIQTVKDFGIVSFKNYNVFKDTE
jgi:hypothetical protein